MTKPYKAKSDAALQRAINRFASACNDKAFQGTIHYTSARYYAVDEELDASRAALERLVERRAQL